MINLSYTTMNALINEPHTWINKQMGLKTYSTSYMEEGKVAHEIIQDHICGKKKNDLLNKLPSFDIVEREPFDPKCKLELKINNKYSIFGYVDGKDTGRKDILEIKTGSPWSIGKFNALVQWKLYGLMDPEYNKIWLASTPRDAQLWDEYNIKIFNMAILEGHRQTAREFVDKAIYTIEHIRDYELKKEVKSRWCYYIDCPYCPEYDAK